MKGLANALPTFGEQSAHWNFLYAGGTTLLTTTCTPAERGRVQETNDMTIFAVGLVCSFGAGALLDVLRWQRLNLVLLPWLAAAALVLVWQERRVRHPGARRLTNNGEKVDARV